MSYAELVQFPFIRVFIILINQTFNSTDPNISLSCL